MTTVNRINKHFSIILIFLMIFLAQEAISQTNSFYVYFKQNGKRVNIVKNKVELKKEPFKMFVEYTQAVDLFVNVSNSSKTYLKAKSGKLMYALPGFLDLKDLKSMFIKKNELFVAKETTQIWEKGKTDGEKDIKTKKGHILVSKNVDKIYYAKKIKDVDLNEYKKNTFLVFIYAEKDKDGSYLEIQREIVKIDWVNKYEEDTKLYARKKKIEGKQKIRQAKRNLKRKQRLERKEKERLAKIEAKRKKEAEKAEKEKK